MRQIPNVLSPANGETRTTFNQMNQLIQVENHDGSDYQLQAAAVYDGQNNRLQTISYFGGSPVVVTYTPDILNRGLPLFIDNPIASDTWLLYGLVGLGEYQDEWRYYLGDGRASVRQLADSSGNITLARTYDAFGLLLQQSGGRSDYGSLPAWVNSCGVLMLAKERPSGSNPSISWRSTKRTATRP